MGDLTLRTQNSAITVKIETTEGVDAGPLAADAVPFEQDGYSYNFPYTSEASIEATGTLVAGAPLVKGRPAEVSIKVRLKGANAGYTASVKPPHHVLMLIAGLRGLFTAAIASAALTAGTATSATLGTGFSTTVDAYVGMPLDMTGGVGAGARPFVTDYSGGKVATLTDEFGSALTTATSAAIPANWTYAGTSPRDASERATDHPSATIYIYEDGTLHKFTGMRGVLEDLSADSAGVPFATFRLTGIYGGKSDAAVPSGIATPAHSAPTLVQGTGNLPAAFSISRKPLPISQFSIKPNGEVSSPDDPNTNFGFGAGLIGGREPVLTCDPLATLVATRDTLSQIANGVQTVGVIRFLGAVNNRIGITLPMAQPTEANPGTREKLRSDELTYRLLDSGRDAQGRNSDMIICFH